MQKKQFIFGFILVFFLALSSGCTNSELEKKPTISIDSDSDYVTTFKDLNLGVLYDFDFKLPNADNSWVNLWVERYNDGKLDSQPLTQLSYGNSPTEMEEGHLGFGIINPNSEAPLVFLYGPGVRTQPSVIEKESKTIMASAWDYAIGNEDVELELGETTILAAYRETESNSFRTVDLQDEEAVKTMIQQNDTVLLLKIKIEEEPRK
ncbi:hypothetical protein [Bacillus suaedae]|uniref:Lipoprotein n=1 Tax=Halalkalibacter suaedae TaxID=2822140 RepID=A0A941ASW2_9BACI|nr:hypothetical protein [Bacillus suaedae]MBP3950114.1 hypothetical protein [Bacillus suaedae]